MLITAMLIQRPSDWSQDRLMLSTIVNLDKVSELHPHSNGECFLILKGGGELKVSRTYKDVVGRFL